MGDLGGFGLFAATVFFFYLFIIYIGARPDPYITRSAQTITPPHKEKPIPGPIPSTPPTYSVTVITSSVKTKIPTESSYAREYRHVLYQGESRPVLWGSDIESNRVYGNVLYQVKIKKYEAAYARV